MRILAIGATAGPSRLREVAAHIAGQGYDLLLLCLTEAVADDWIRAGFWAH